MHPEDKAKFFNRWWRITHLYPIQTKQAGKTSRLILNPVQQVLRRYMDWWNYHLTLKARQEGVSTLHEIWHLDGTMHVPNTKTCILADCRENLDGLFQIIKFAYEGCPQEIRLADGSVWQKPKAKYDNRNELFFEGINSTIYVALTIRSKTVHRLHVSEWAWLKEAQKKLTATFAAVPKDGIITGESTANGMGGSFYEEWVNEDSRFMKHFFGYQDHPDYCDDIPDPEAFLATLTEDEHKILQHPNMKPGNIAWRRRYLSIAANRKEFAQEFPATAEEAFLTSGRSPFDRAKIKDWIIRKPLLSKMEGRLLYWFLPVKGKRYILSCDTASGRGIENLDQADAKEGGTDYDVIQVWDCQTLQLCAMFRGKWPYAKLHEIVVQLGREYHDAYVVIEATDHGLTVINNLTDHTNYPKAMIHSTQVLDQKSKKMTTKWGWYTNLKTKPLVLDYLAQLIDDELIRCHSAKVQSECLRFEIDDKGQMHAMEGYHDDTVMCAAFGLYCVPNALRAGRMTATKAELGLKGM
jgi:hypothetical protein